MNHLTLGILIPIAVVNQGLSALSFPFSLCYSFNERLYFLLIDLITAKTSNFGSLSSEGSSLLSKIQGESLLEINKKHKGYREVSYNP